MLLQASLQIIRGREALAAGGPLDLLAEVLRNRVACPVLAVGFGALAEDPFPRFPRRARSGATWPGRARRPRRFPRIAAPYSPIPTRSRVERIALRPGVLRPGVPAPGARPAGSYRPEIDGLRAVAVAAVIAYHFDEQILPGGYLGVDIFFVISGFVITASLAARAPVGGLGSFLGGFYARRVRRIVPALVLCVVLSGLLICLFDPTPRVSLETGMTALAGVSNLFLLAQETDYFARASELNAFTQTWSLGVEEQFYLLFPLLVWASGFVRGTRHGARLLLLLVGALSAASLAAFITLTRTAGQEAAAFFLMPTRFWELGTGCLLFLLLPRQPTVTTGPGALHAGWRRFVHPLAALLPLLAALWVPDDYRIAGTCLVVGLTAALILTLTLRPDRAASTLLPHPALVAVGLISYSLYLWHWTILSLSRWTIGIDWWTVPIQLTLMLLLAIASYRWVEQPLRRRAWRPSDAGTIGCGIGALLVAAGGIWVLKVPLKRVFFLGGEPAPAARERLTELAVPGTTVTARACGDEHGDATLLADPRAFARLATTCSAESPVPGRPAPRTFLTGDSHALAFVPMAALRRQSANEPFTLFTRGGCPFPITRHGHQKALCGPFLQASEAWILSHGRPGDRVVVVNYLLSHLGDTARLKDSRNEFLGADGRPLRGAAKRHAFVASVNAFADRAARRGMTTVLLGATPRNLDAAICQPAWYNLQIRLRCEAGVAAELRHAADLNRELRRELSPRVRFFDPLPVLCRRRCDNARVIQLLRDRDHLSTPAVLSLADGFSGVLEGKDGKPPAVDPQDR